MLATFNCDKVTEHLIVGAGLTGADEVAYLAAQGVTHIISAAVELDDGSLARAAGLRFLHIPWSDDGQPKPAGDFYTALAWVQQQQAQLPPGKQIGLYVHCAAGVNRGPLLATFLLAALSGLPGDTAWTTVKSMRPVANAFEVPAYRQSCLDALAALRPLPPTPLPEPPVTTSPTSPTSTSEATSEGTSNASSDSPKASSAAGTTGTTGTTSGSGGKSGQTGRGGERGGGSDSLAVAVEATAATSPASEG